MTKPALEYQPRSSFVLLVGLSSRVAIAALLIFSGGRTVLSTEQHYLAETGVSGNNKSSPTQERINWNDSKINWQSYEAGLKTAKSI